MQSSEFREFGGLGAFGEEEGYRTMDWSYEKRQLGVVREMVRKGELISPRAMCRSELTFFGGQA